MTFFRRLIRALLLVPAFTACAAVFDIEEAKHDPALDKGGAGGAAANTDAGPEDLCTKYCKTITKACTGQDEQYTLDEKPAANLPSTICMDVCGRLPVGATTDTSGNTMGCRLHYAQEAATAASLVSGGEVGELDNDCRAAGPGGNGVCGTNCDAVCTLAGPTCDSEKSEMTLAQQLILKESTCRAECAQLPDTGDYNDLAVHQMGGSVQCRVYHVSAAQLNMQFHCPHVGGASPCAGTPTISVGSVGSDGGIVGHL